MPTPGGINYQPAVTPVAHDMHWLSFWCIRSWWLIVIFVTALLLIVIFRFNRRRNPTPASWTHNTKVEIAWTLMPVVILIVIGSFSLPILFKQLEVPTPGPDGQGDRQPVVLVLLLSRRTTFSFDSLMLDAGRAGGARLSARDAPARRRQCRWWCR